MMLGNAGVPNAIAGVLAGAGEEGGVGVVALKTEEEDRMHHNGRGEVGTGRGAWPRAADSFRKLQRAGDPLSLLSFTWVSAQ